MCVCVFALGTGQAAWSVQAVNQLLSDGILTDRKLICPSCVITANLPDCHISCCYAHLPHTHSAWLPETVTNTHVEHKVALAVSRVHCPHLPEAEKKLTGVFSPFRLCICADLQNPTLAHRGIFADVSLPLPVAIGGHHPPVLDSVFILLCTVRSFSPSLQ